MGGPPQLDDEGRWTEAPVPVPVEDADEEAQGPTAQTQAWLDRAHALLAAAEPAEAPRLRLVAG
jgi:hypothetical protein